MTAPTVTWVLERLQPVASALKNEYTQLDGSPVQLKRVDRDNAQIYDTDQRLNMDSPPASRTGQLEAGLFVGAASAAGQETPLGTEYDLDVERVVSLRLEGLDSAQYGHVDPSGDAGVPFSEVIRRVRAALYAGRKRPQPETPNISFRHLELANPAPQSDNYRDYYRYDVDVVFSGYERL